MTNKIDNIVSIVLAGGQGTRLFPLTLNHCKPAVCYGGKYRLIDIPISNSINSNIKKIYVLAQFLTGELQYHLQNAYRFDQFSRGEVHFLSPEEKPNQEKVWFEGTADAVRKSLPTLLKAEVDYFLILSGDQLYNIDFSKMYDFAIEMDADLTIAALPVEKNAVDRLGILKTDVNHHVLDFIEKPKDHTVLQNYRLPQKIGEKEYLGSMGIYIFKKSALISLLEEDKRVDFGHHLIPTQIKKGKTVAFFYDGYWEDIGTIESYYLANLALTDPHFALDLYNEKRPIYTIPSFLPGPKINNTHITDSIICDGAYIEAKEISHSIIGIRTRVGENTIIRDSVFLGNHFYNSPLHTHESITFKASVGKNCIIQNAIIDEDVKIGNNVHLVNKKRLQTFDGDGVYIRDGLIVIPSNVYVKDGFVL